MEPTRSRMGAKAPRRGSATVEFAILLPLYALVILSTLYFGYGWLIHQEECESNLYAVHNPSSQISDPDFRELFYVAYEGDPQQTEDNPTFQDRRIFWANNPAGGNDPMDFHDLLQELSYTFWGGFEVQGGDLVWRTQGGKNNLGRYIDEHNIMGNEELDGMEWATNGWVTRNVARTTYTHNPSILGGMNADVGPTAGGGGGFAALDIESHIDTLVRGSKKREMVDDVRGVSSEIYDLIDRFSDAEEMPGYPGFGGSDGFWEQDVRPDLD